jgi:hypothetical protein
MTLLIQGLKKKANLEDNKVCVYASIGNTEYPWESLYMKPYVGDDKEEITKYFNGITFSDLKEDILCQLRETNINQDLLSHRRLISRTVLKTELPEVFGIHTDLVIRFRVHVGVDDVYPHFLNVSFEITPTHSYTKLEIEVPVLSWYWTSKRGEGVKDVYSCLDGKTLLRIELHESAGVFTPGIFDTVFRKGALFVISEAWRQALDTEKYKEKIDEYYFKIQEQLQKWQQIYSSQS